MQTIEEYKEYTKQLEGEVGKWHNAYDALMIERNQMAKTLCENKKIIETMATELDELRKHEVEWDLAQARIKELEAEKKAKNEEIDALHQKYLARLEEPFFDKLPEEAKTEIQRAHLEMVLNSDFKPIYVNVAPNAPIHKG